MKTNILNTTIAALFFVFIFTSATTPSESTFETESNYTEEILEIEDWMASDDFWGINNTNNKQISENREEPLEIEDWMIDDELWGF